MGEFRYHNQEIADANSSDGAMNGDEEESSLLSEEEPDEHGDDRAHLPGVTGDQGLESYYSMNATKQLRAQRPNSSAELQRYISQKRYEEYDSGLDVTRRSDSNLTNSEHYRRKREAALLTKSLSKNDPVTLQSERNIQPRAEENLARSETYRGQQTDVLLTNTSSGINPMIAQSGRNDNENQLKSSDDVSDISSSSVEEEQEDDHNDEKAGSPVGRVINLSGPNLSGADVICNRSGMNRQVTRSDVANRLAMSSRFSKSGSVHSAFQRQPLTSSYGFSAMYEDAASRRSGSSAGASGPWSSRGISVPPNSGGQLHSRPSSDGGNNSNTSPYYDYAGGWLRLRPQNHAQYDQTRRDSLPSNSTSTPKLRSMNMMKRSSSSSQHSPVRHDYNEQYVAVLGTTDEEDNKIETTEDPQEETDSIHDFEGTQNSNLKNDDNSMGEIQDGVANENDDNPGNGPHPFSNGNDPTPPLRPTGVPRSTSNSIDTATQWASPDSKFERYACRVDHSQGDKAIEIPLFLFERPHMRAFHFAWMSFFVAFFTWFAISPLLKEIKKSLGLTHREVFISNVFSSAGTVVCRIVIGPLCDRFGARWVMATTLIIAAIPVMATGLVNNAVELSILRLITGVAGASFVTCQYWTSSMFSREIAGTANSLAAGWGNLGGGVTNIVMGSALFPLFKVIYGENSDGGEKEDAADRAWRIVCIVPAVLSFVMAYIILKYSDDSPKGNYMKMKRLGLIRDVQAMKALREAARDYNTWLLFIHYGCCFGVEVTMTAAAALYFSEEFLLSTESAAAIASIFGWLNLFARGLGGFTSDILNVIGGMRGRFIWHALTLILEGIFLLAFGRVNTLGGAIATMVILSLFVQCAEVSFVWNHIFKAIV